MQINKPKKIMVAHGSITHPLEDRLDCMSCIQIEIDFLQELKKWGGQTKFLKSLKDDKT